VDIAVAHAAEEDLDLNVFRPGVATFYFVRSEWTALVHCRISFGLDHDFS